MPQWAAGIGAPVAAAAAWGAVVAPKAALEVPGGVRLAVEAAVFGAAAVALAAAGQGVLAVAFAALCVGSKLIAVRAS